MEHSIRQQATRATLFAVAWLFALAAHAQDDARHLEQAIDRHAEKFVREAPAAGLSIAVAHADELVYGKGFGFADLENQVPATPETLFRIGSITKSFTAAAILQLVEQERLRLSNTLGEVLPEYPEPGRAITIRQLLNHTSGIPSFTSFPDYATKKREDLDREEMLEWFATKPLEFEPGTEFRYSNSGYYVLGLVIERVSGQSYEDYLKDHVLAPARLSATRYDWPEPIVPHRARGYSRAGDTFQHADFVSMSVPYAAGALASTALDLVRWMRALSTGAVISEASFTLMTSEAELGNGRTPPYGFGLAVGELNGQLVVRHAGGIDGFRSDIAYLPKSEWIVAVLVNSVNADPGALVERIAEELIELEPAAAQP